MTRVPASVVPHAARNRTLPMLLFASLMAAALAESVPAGTWQEYTYAEDGFAASFPTKPRFSRIIERGPNPDVPTNEYDSVDADNDYNVSVGRIYSSGDRLSPRDAQD